MRRQIPWALALTLALATPVVAQRVELNVRGSANYVVYVDGSEVSRHATEREAIERVTLVLSVDPTAEVHYIHDYRVDVRLADAPSPSSASTLQSAPLRPEVDAVAATARASSSALHPNEPPGFVPLYDNDGSYGTLFNLDDLDDHNGWYDGRSWERNAQVIEDRGNPTGSGRTVRMTHPAGTGGPAAKLNRFSEAGSELGGTGYAGGGVAEQYLSLRIRIPEGHSGCDGVSNGMKLFYLGMEPAAKVGSGANEFFLAVCVNEGWQIQTGGGGTSNDEFVSLSWPRSSPASWHLELLRTAESRVGGRDGTMTIWVDGRQVRRWTGLAWGDPTRSGRLFDGIELYHTQHPPSAPHQWLQDELYVSGR